MTHTKPTHLIMAAGRLAVYNGAQTAQTQYTPRLFPIKEARFFNGLRFHVIF